MVRNGFEQPHREARLSAEIPKARDAALCTGCGVAPKQGEYARIPPPGRAASGPRQGLNWLTRCASRASADALFLEGKTNTKKRKEN